MRDGKPTISGKRGWLPKGRPGDGSDASAVAALGTAHGHFAELLSLAESHFAAGDNAIAVRIAQIAARYAFPASVGLFSSNRLETLLLNVGRQIESTQTSSHVCRSSTRRRVLHVLSYAKPIGGDSRCAWRWIQEDRASEHSVVVTSQAEISDLFEIPRVLVSAAEESGGFFRVLGAACSQPLDQAKELRALSQWADLVVLHLYPYDVVPLLALSAGCQSIRTLFVNHADHAFWIGTSVSHLIVNLRRQPRNFLAERRGVCVERSSILPIPLKYSPSPFSRSEAKRLLGHGPDVVLLLTVASPFKYSAPGQIGLLDLVTPVIASRPNVVLLAVGPKPDGRWMVASKQTGGRIIPLGTQWQNDVLYAAADIYLDSAPFSSITSLLEAGTHGAPLVGFHPFIGEMSLLGAGAPGLDDSIEVAKDANSYRELLTRLIDDADFRCASGRRVQQQILSLHTGREWSQAVHRLYDAARHCEAPIGIGAQADQFNPGPLERALSQLYSQVQDRRHVTQLIGHFIGTLPFRVRIQVTWRLHAKGFALCFLNLLPPPADVIIRKLGRRAKRMYASFRASARSVRGTSVAIAAGNDQASARADARPGR